ncbi:MAG: hypothetical protein HY064_14325 [Bacteroidetes bacterium]|nr:hypothetical protein [Bacteroidota bacterium]
MKLFLLQMQSQQKPLQPAIMFFVIEAKAFAAGAMSFAIAAKANALVIKTFAIRISADAIGASATVFTMKFIEKQQFTPKGRRLAAAIGATSKNRFVLFFIGTQNAVSEKNPLLSLSKEGCVFFNCGNLFTVRIRLWVPFYKGSYQQTGSEVCFVC